MGKLKSKILCYCFCDSIFICNDATYWWYEYKKRGSNNPLNIRRGKDQWQGLKAQQTDAFRHAARVGAALFMS